MCETGGPTGKEVKEMEHDEKGVMKWVHTTHLYREWYWHSAKVCLEAFALTAAIPFVFFTVIIGFADEFTLDGLVLQSKIWGGVFLLLCVLTFPCLFIWAWANGGVDEWAYEMDKSAIRGRKILHNPGRMKVLRAFAWIAMFMPAKPGQKMALRRLLYDNSEKEKYVGIVRLKSVSGDEKNGKISIDTFNGATEIFVPHDGYAEVLEYLEGRLAKKKRGKLS